MKRISLPPSSFLQMPNPPNLSTTPAPAPVLCVGREEGSSGEHTDTMVYTLVPDVL